VPGQPGAPLTGQIAAQLKQSCYSKLAPCKSAISNLPQGNYVGKIVHDFLTELHASAPVSTQTCNASDGVKTGAAAPDDTQDVLSGLAGSPTPKLTPTAVLTGIYVKIGAILGENVARQVGQRATGKMPEPMKDLVLSHDALNESDPSTPSRAGEASPTSPATPLAQPTTPPLQTIAGAQPHVPNNAATNPINAHGPIAMNGTAPFHASISEITAVAVCSGYGSSTSPRAS